MRKADIVHRMTEETACTSLQATEAVDAILATLKETLHQGEPVILRRFGTWHVRAKRARLGRNPRTGAAATIAARRVVRFTASQTLKTLVEQASTPVP
jgi:nucleoid DNA-binding protein